MAEHGINAVRVYTTPPVWLLDLAAEAGLRVMAGIPWEQHIAFLDDLGRARDIERRVRSAVRGCAGHPAVLCYSIGNEIPASIVRWAGWRRVEAFLRRLYETAKSQDPGALVTYGNFPSTEYLELPFLELVSFNVYLEKPVVLARYLARLQNIAGERPLILGEIGLDSRRNGRHGQASNLTQQLRVAFAGGCAGAFVFSWTDEWHRGGQEVSDWDFGITTRERAPKPALAAVSSVYREGPFSPRAHWPRVSIVVCVHNGEKTIAECLGGLERLAYPDYEIIVVDDGSTDSTAEIAARHPCRLIQTTNHGLSSARNTGIAAADGELVAFIDADAWPDPHWLHYTVETLRQGGYVGVGGPNPACAGDGSFAECVAQAPGGPTHVLLSDRVAEHIPGVNMTFRRAALQEIGGFDTRFRVAGDDVDLCWRLQERGWKLGFSPAAIVWHHQRSTLRAYGRQQRGYGHAEALLEEKWPQKYNASGQVAWTGRIYTPLLYALHSTTRIYHGTWGTAPFQPRHPEAGRLSAFAAAPEWYLVLGALAALSLLSLAWRPLLVAVPLLVVSLCLSLWHAVLGAMGARFPSPAPTLAAAFRRRVITGFLFLFQPWARLAGRVLNGLTPWRSRRPLRLGVPWPRQVSMWSERWRDTPQWLESLERELMAMGAVVRRGGPYDRWDLQVRDGARGVVRLRMCVEDHGAGRQLLRFRVWPWVRTGNLMWWLSVGPTVLALLAAVDGASLAAALLGTVGAAFLLDGVRQTCSAMSLVIGKLRRVAGVVPIAARRFRSPLSGARPREATGRARMGGR